MVIQNAVTFRYWINIEWINESQISSMKINGFKMGQLYLAYILRFKEMRSSLWILAILCSMAVRKSIYCLWMSLCSRRELFSSKDMIDSKHLQQEHVNAIGQWFEDNDGWLFKFVVKTTGFYPALRFPNSNKVENIILIMEKWPWLIFYRIYRYSIKNRSRMFS